MTVYCFTKYEWAIWLQSVTVYLIHKTRKFYYNGIKQLLRRNKISFLDEWPLLQRLTGIKRAAIIMKCERTECINVSNKIHRKKSHLLSLSFFLQIDCSDCFEVVQGAFSNGKALGTRQSGEVWRHVTMVAKFLDLNNPSWQRRPFASSNDGRSCNNARESHTFHAIHVRFFLSNLQIFISSLSCKELYHGHLASWVRRDRASKRGNPLGESRKQQQQKNKTS